jgi:hypothetical protein
MPLSSYSATTLAKVATAYGVRLLGKTSLPGPPFQVLKKITLTVPRQLPHVCDGQTSAQRLAKPR